MSFHDVPPDNDTAEPATDAFFLEASESPTYGERFMESASGQGPLANVDFWSSIRGQLEEDSLAGEALSGCEPVCDDTFLGAYHDGELSLRDPAVLDFESLLPYTPQTAGRLASLQHVSDLIRDYAVRAEAACSLDIALQTIAALQKEEARARWASPRLWAPAAAAAALFLAALTSGVLPELQGGPSSVALQTVSSQASQELSSVSPGALVSRPLTAEGQNAERLLLSQPLASSFSPLASSSGRAALPVVASYSRKGRSAQAFSDTLSVNKPFLSTSGMLAMASPSSDAQDPYALAPETRQGFYQRRLAQSLMEASQQLLQQIAAQQGAGDVPAAAAPADLLASSEGASVALAGTAQQPPADIPTPEDVALSACDASSLPADAAADAVFYSCGRNSGL
ncbi:MAG: hypothetical protein IPK79_08430 [Vampirovibrionales bacterium]|nr:hypothetical protein [Vampirovibrionales bacterium]